MSAALLPCPFCGGPVQLERTHKSRHEIYGERQWWGVRCTNTVNVGGTCAIESIPTASPEAAIERWNRRSPAIAPPVAAGSVNTAPFRLLFTGYPSDADNVAEFVDAWGAQQRQYGWDQCATLNQEAIRQQRQRAEKAEADLKQVNEWREAALASNQKMQELMAGKLTAAEARVKELETALSLGGE